MVDFLLVLTDEALGQEAPLWPRGYRCLEAVLGSHGVGLAGHAKRCDRPSDALLGDIRSPLWDTGTKEAKTSGMYHL